MTIREYAEKLADQMITPCILDPEFSETGQTEYCLVFGTSQGLALITDPSCGNQDHLASCLENCRDILTKDLCDVLAKMDCAALSCDNEKLTKANKRIEYLERLRYYAHKFMSAIDTSKMSEDDKARYIEYSKHLNKNKVKKEK